MRRCASPGCELRAGHASLHARRWHCPGLGWVDDEWGDYTPEQLKAIHAVIDATDAGKELRSFYVPGLSVKKLDS